MNSHSDEELMERIQARDEQALEILIHRFTQILRSIASRILLNDQDVREVVDEVFLSVWNQAENFDSSKGKAIGWIITIVRRRAIDRTRRCQAYQRAAERLRHAHEMGVSHFSGDDVEEHAAIADAGDALRQMMATLPAAQSDVVRMAFYRGLSHRDIARETGLPLGTVKTRLELGVKKLRTAILAIGSREVWLDVRLGRPERKTNFGRPILARGSPASGPLPDLNSERV